MDSSRLWRAYPVAMAQVTTVAMTNAALDYDAYNETSISVSPNKPTVLAAACNFQRQPYFGTFRRIAYGISLSGVLGPAPFSETGLLPIPPLWDEDPNQWEWWDPMTAASQVGSDLWIGSCIRRHPINNVRIGGFSVWRATGLGTLSISDPGAIEPTQWEDDKGMLSVGPDTDPQHSGETMYLNYFRGNYPGSGTLPMLMWRGSTGSFPGAAWGDAESRIDPGEVSPDDRHGSGPMSVVMPAGSDLPGRLVVAYGVATTFPSERVHIEVCRNDNPHINTEGQWAVEKQLDREFGVVGEPFIYPFSNGFGVALPGGTLVLGNHPSICRDPTNVNKIYVAFVGTPQSSSFPIQNLDIYIAMSPDAGVTWPRVQRLTDAMLGDPGDSGSPNGTDHFFPAIAVDGFGGVNLVYHRTVLPYSGSGEPFIDVSYVRIANPVFPLQPGSVSAPIRLTPPYQPIPTSPARIGDYLSIGASGCLVYACYPKVEAGGLRSNVYISRISLCPADIDGSGLVTSEDVPAFAMEFGQSSQKADLNHDGLHTGTDVECFLNAYTCGCAQQP